MFKLFSDNKGGVAEILKTHKPNKRITVLFTVIGGGGVFQGEFEFCVCAKEVSKCHVENQIALLLNLKHITFENSSGIHFIPTSKIDMLTVDKWWSRDIEEGLT